MVAMLLPTKDARRLANGKLRNGYAKAGWKTRIDGRLRAGIEIKRLVEVYSSQLGKAANTPLVARRIREIAETETLLARIRLEALRGEFTDLTAINRLANTCSRLRVAVGLDRPVEEPLLAGWDV
jgi:hypothetical protein